ncbi:hypothetical protein LJB71_07280 [Thermomonas sp. S9]|uniref:hypothetical protein n=1 Tax=Thermomonas sp. S9 TaxID=2885203 RepID=UPI00216AE651|nr:hypothetical protein [Thermomonas sp. S9]MCR6496040.1 hypothetical protein [Thermomonas sp. S9]
MELHVEWVMDIKHVLQGHNARLGTFDLRVKRRICGTNSQMRTIKPIGFVEAKSVCWVNSAL